MPCVLFVTKKKIPFIYYTIVLSMITFGKLLLAIVYNLTLHTMVWYGMVWYGNCLFDKIKSTLKHNSKYIISES